KNAGPAVQRGPRHEQAAGMARSAPKSVLVPSRIPRRGLYRGRGLHRRKEGRRLGQYSPQQYKAADFSHLKGLQGLSDQQIEIHLGLYQGYVTNTNKV